MEGRVPVLFLHIGASKTGTSALQAAFASNAKALADHGIVYPSSRSNAAAAAGKITSGNGLALATYLDPSLNLKSGVKDVLGNFTQALRSAEGKHVLYSSEMLARFRVARMRSILEIASAEGFSVSIVFYVRSIAGHAYSTYIQKLKRTRYTGSFGDFLEIYDNTFMDTIKRAERTVSRDRLVVRNYDTARKDLFRDFVESVLSIDYSKAGFAEVSVVNRSLSFYEVEFMRCMNDHLQEAFQSAFASDAIIYAAPDVGQAMVLSAEEKKRLADEYGNDLEWINRYVGNGPIDIVGDDVEIGDRPVVQFTEFERCMISLVARLIPTRRDKAAAMRADWVPGGQAGARKVPAVRGDRARAERSSGLGLLARDEPRQ
jgi:hypothetical protein